MKQLIQRQAENPAGLIGRLFGSLMDVFNTEDSRWTIELLNLKPDDNMLEVGFGTGRAIEYAAAKITHGLIVGIDHSETMLDVASKHNANAITANCVQLQLGEVEAIPFPDGFFDKACSVNCIYFWEPPQTGLAELHRVLKPGGMLAITARHKQLDVYRHYTPEIITELMKEAGFTNIVALQGRPRRFPSFCVTGYA